VSSHEEASPLVMANLKDTLSGMVKAIFGDVEMKWVESYFPFTDPSLELEILFNGKWLEVLGCGVVRETILENGGITAHTGWAFGLGLERLAMILFDVPDIRLFWSLDPRFSDQFLGRATATATASAARTRGGKTFRACIALPERTRGVTRLAGFLSIADTGAASRRVRQQREADSQVQAVLQVSVVLQRRGLLAPRRPPQQRRVRGPARPGAPSAQ